MGGMEEIAPPEDHRTKLWHWIKVYSGEVWALRWDNRTGHWLSGNQALSPKRAAELKWRYIRPTEPAPTEPPSAIPA